MVSQRIANPSYELFRSTSSILVFSAKCRGTLAGRRRSLENCRTAMFCEFESHPRRQKKCRYSVTVTLLPSKQTLFGFESRYLLQRPITAEK